MCSRDIEGMSRMVSRKSPGEATSSALVINVTMIISGMAARIRLMRKVFMGKSEVRSQKSEVRSQRSEVRSQKSEVRSQKSGVRSQRSEVRGQKSEVRSQGSEVRSATLK